MPFLASTDGSIVRAEDFGTEFTREDYLECPHCDRKMHFNKCTTRVDHFSHEAESSNGSTSAGGCGHAGESKEHELMKKKAVTQLRENYSQWEAIELEKEIGDKFADVAGTFEETHDVLGEGICVEVQYKNNSKEYLDTTATYMAENYAVCWMFYDNWSGLFEAKESIQEHIFKPIYLGHVDNIDEEGDIGQPITPQFTPEGEVLAKFGLRDFALCDIESKINSLTAHLAAREVGEVHPNAPTSGRSREVIVEFFMDEDFPEPDYGNGDFTCDFSEATDEEIQSIHEVFEKISLNDLHSLFSIEAVLKGYGISENELNILRIGKTPRGLKHENCKVCEELKSDCVEWQLFRSFSGGLYNICGDCRSEIDNSEDTLCALCGRPIETSKEITFGPIGKHPMEYDVCRVCRSTVMSDEPIY